MRHEDAADFGQSERAGLRRGRVDLDVAPRREMRALPCD